MCPRTHNLPTALHYDNLVFLVGAPDTAVPTDVFHIHSRRDNKEGALRKEEERDGDLPYLASAYTQTKTSHDFKRERQKKKNCQALSFSQDGLSGLIRTPSPTSYLPSSCIPCIHTHVQLTALRSTNTTPSTTHTHTQTNQAVVDLCTGACGKLRSNIITVCLFHSGPILSSFLSALSALRLAQVKTLRRKSICLDAAKGVGNR